MHRVIVIGSVNHDRIWQLDDPLVPGGRLRFSSQVTHLGGGGFYTGRQLLELGNDVALVSRLMRDDAGFATLKTLQEMGFDTAQVAMLEGETTPLEILLEPNGERTIMSSSSRRSPPYAALAPFTGDAAYLNALELDPDLVKRLEAIPVVLSQLPLRPATPRPADYVISSKDDAAGEIEATWQRAGAAAAGRLKMLILTDGPRPITLFDGQEIKHVDPAPSVRVKSTIGAGDCFSGAFLSALIRGHTADTAAAEASHITADWLIRRENS